MLNVNVVFNKIPEILARQASISDETLNDVGEFVRQKAHDRCSVKGSTSADGYYTSPYPPRDPGRAGEVRRSIKKTAPSNNQIKIGSNHMIAPMLEQGSSRETPKPFMRPAIDENQNHIVGMISEALEKSIRGVLT